MLTTLRRAFVGLGVLVAAVAAYAALGVLGSMAIGERVTATVAVNLVVVVAVLLARRWRPDWFRIRGADQRPLSLELGALLVVATACAFLAGQSHALFLVRISDEGVSGVAEARAGAEPWLVLLHVLLVAPLAEEMLFRGVIYPVLRRSWAVVPAVAVTSLAFGLMHGNPVQAAVAVPLGVVAALAVERTGRVWPAVAMHMAFNLASVSLARSLDGLDGVSALVVTTVVFAIAVALLGYRVPAR